MGLKNVFSLIAAMVVVAQCLHLSEPVNDPWVEAIQKIWKIRLTDIALTQAAITDGADPSEFVDPCPQDNHADCIMKNGKMVKSPPIDRDTIVVLGSSVANGTGAFGHGWADILIEKVQQRNPKKKLLNFAYPWITLAQASERWDPANYENASAVILGLSLGNEGITDLSRQQTKKLMIGWTSELLGFADRFTVPVFIGGLYPHGNYTYKHELAIQEANRVIKTSKYPVFDFLSQPIDDGNGKWREELMTQDDPVHPNAEGHKLMAQAITQTQIDMLAGLK
jgi:lysophospholipase L1-like esterase